MLYVVRSFGRAVILIAIIVVGGCAPRLESARRVESPASTSLSTAPPPTASVASATAGPAATRPAPAESSPTQMPPAPAPIVGPAWGDREVYRSGLVASEQSILDELPGATEYRLALEIDESLKRVDGRQQALYTNREQTPLNEIYLRLFPNALGGVMDVRSVTVNGEPVEPKYEFQATALRVPLPEPLQPGERAVIGLDYDIKVPESPQTGYGLLSYTDGVLALDTPYAAIPVYDASGWNVGTPPENADTSFNDAGFYLAEIVAPPDLTLVVTGKEVAEQADAESKSVTYALGPARDFYLAASRDFTLKSEQSGEVLVNSYALPGKETARDAALATAAEAIDVFSRRLGPYPYTELDIASTPMLALGIEYPGLAGISDRVYDPEIRVADRSAAAALESTVAHEVAHQWFYNLVGNDQIDEPWLDEAITQYATGIYFLDRYGEAGAEGWRDTWTARWERTDLDQKPVGLAADQYEPREYGSIVYGRGPLFLEALAERMGGAEFHEFLGTYARTFRWDIASAADFKRMAEETCACELDDLYEEWLNP